MDGWMDDKLNYEYKSDVYAFIFVYLPYNMYMFIVCIRLDFDSFVLNDAEASSEVEVKKPNLSAHGQCLIDKFQVLSKVENSFCF